MTSEDIFSEQAWQELRELVGYEDWLLQSVYKLTEYELFPEWPDATVYDAKSQIPVTTGFGRCHVVLGDWRPGFLQAAAPLVFVASFKLLDMLFEWILKRNKRPADFSFSKKMKQLEAPGLLYPHFLNDRPWLLESLYALYKRSEPLRGTIIHSRHFDSENGGLCVASSKKDVIGERIEFSEADLRTFAQLSVSVLRYLYGDWHLNVHREKWLRWQIDALQSLHKLKSFGQVQPRHTRVRWNTHDPDLRVVDVRRIQKDLSDQNPGQDVTFDLRIVVSEAHQPIVAYLIPYETLSGWTPCRRSDGPITAVRFLSRPPQRLQYQYVGRWCWIAPRTVGSTPNPGPYFAASSSARRRNSSIPTP